MFVTFFTCRCNYIMFFLHRQPVAGISKLPWSKTWVFVGSFQSMACLAVSPGFPQATPPLAWRDQKWNLFERMNQQDPQTSHRGPTNIDHSDRRFWFVWIWRFESTKIEHNFGQVRHLFCSFCLDRTGLLNCLMFSMKVSGNKLPGKPSYDPNDQRKHSFELRFGTKKP